MRFVLSLPVCVFAIQLTFLSARVKAWFCLKTGIPQTETKRNVEKVTYFCSSIKVNDILLLNRTNLIQANTTSCARNVITSVVANSKNSWFRIFRLGAKIKEMRAFCPPDSGWLPESMDNVKFTLERENSLTVYLRGFTTGLLYEFQ